METLDNLLSQLEKIQGWPAVALVFASCIVVGYLWKFLPFKWCASAATPAFVILWGAFAQSMLADGRPAGASLRLWIWRNLLVGLVIGFAAWLTHNLVISRIEDLLAARFGKPAPTPPTSTETTVLPPKT